jgi:membrane associated rhomboid family serine protease
MPISERSYLQNYSGRGFPTGVKWLLIANVVIFVLQVFTFTTRAGGLFTELSLVPVQVATQLALWQLVTYMFLHGSITHVLFNMLTLWWFGPMIEQIWGTKKFLTYYFLCGIGAGAITVIVNLLLGSGNVPTIGASGAIYGVLLAYGVMFPDAIILAFFIFPMKAKYFVGIMAAIAFVSSFSANSGVSNICHLGGMLVGYLYLQSHNVFRQNVFASIGDRYTAWKLERNKRKFQVYMRKNRSDDDRWVN